MDIDTKELETALNFLDELRPGMPMTIDSATGHLLRAAARAHLEHLKANEPKPIGNMMSRAEQEEREELPTPTEIRKALKAMDSGYAMLSTKSRQTIRRTLKAVLVQPAVLPQSEE